MKKYLILGGAGRQGIAIATALKILDPDCEIHVVDQEDARGLIEGCHPPHSYVRTDLSPVDAVNDLPADVVVSALPYFLNEEVGTLAIENGLRWVDLGGHVQTTQALEKRTLAIGRRPIATDQGLAPGLANILAWKARDDVGVAHTIRILCGGLTPRTPFNFLKYYLTFNPMGLVNEYLNQIDVLIDGRISRFAPLSPTTAVRWNERVFEAFPTSGGAPLSFLEEMQDVGVATCIYETLRYKGHAESIRFLHTAGFTKEQIADAIEKTCSWPGLELEDRVFLGVDVFSPGGSFSSPTTAHRWEIKKPGAGLSAMQKGTGYTAAVVAAMMADGHFDQLRLVSYRDIASTPGFFARLKSLNVLENTQVS